MSVMSLFKYSSFLLIPVLACSLMTNVAVADVYKYRDVYGRIHLTDQPMKGQVKLLKVYRMGGSKRKSSGGADIIKRRRNTYAAMINRVAEEQQLHPELIHAVVRAESAYNPDAVSSKGAVGLMQLMPATAERFGVGDRQDPQQNLNGGARYLRLLLGMFDNDLDLALAAYNAGENAVIRYGRQIPPYPETQNYVRKVQQFYRERGGVAEIERTLMVQ